MRKAPVVLATLLALGASLTLFGNTAQASSVVLDKCQLKLGAGSHYLCDVEQAGNPGEVFSQCFTVDATGEEIFQLLDFLGRNWDCQCDSTGVPGVADFNDKPSKFVCAGRLEIEVCVGNCPGDGISEIGGAFRAEISQGGKKLLLLGVGNFEGDSHSFVATCEKVTTCGDS